MSDLTAKVSKDSKTGSIQVEGFEALKYNFHYDSPVFNPDNSKLADIYQRWKRVLIVMDTSELLPSSSPSSSSPPAHPPRTLLPLVLCFLADLVSLRLLPFHVICTFPRAIERMAADDVF